MKRMILSLLMAALAVGTVMAEDAPPPKGTVGKRQANQQKRIAKGVENGSLTAKETAKVENKEAKINKEVRTERKANGGSLTPEEREKVNKQQNKVSKDIYKQKHDKQTQH